MWHTKTFCLLNFILCVLSDLFFLFSDPRHTCRDDVYMDYPYCEKVNLPMESLLHDMPKNLENVELTNEVILELKHFLEKNGKGVWELACLIPKLIPSFLSANTKSIVSKITRICD